MARCRPHERPLRKIGLYAVYEVIIEIPAKHGMHTVANCIAQVLSIPRAASKLLASVDTAVDELDVLGCAKQIVVILFWVAEEVRRLVQDAY